MIIKELQLLSEGLWESIKNDLDLFSSIQLFVKRLAELDFSQPSNLKDAIIYADKIEEFFARYRKKPGGDPFYIPPTLMSLNDASVKTIHELVTKLKSLDATQYQKEIENIKPKLATKSKGEGQVFIGRGRSKLWARVQVFLQEDLKINPLVFEDESRTSEAITNILDDFLNRSSFAILIMTSEDETSEGKSRARQNVIHEAGLFQGRLGFDKVIMLKQEGLEDFSNMAGLQYIPFSGENIEQCFYELQRKFKKLGLIK